jgi:hypothetical protein
VLAYETTLAEGLKYERRIFHALFATNDQKEGEHELEYLRDFISSDFSKEWPRLRKKGRQISPTHEGIFSPKSRRAGRRPDMDG